MRSVKTAAVWFGLVLSGALAIGCIGMEPLQPGGSSSGGAASSGGAGSREGATSEVMVNGKAADPRELSRLEQQYGTKVAAGRYWLDPRSGLAGRWGGPAQAYAPGFDFGPVPREASGGRSGILFNGRELTQVEVEAVFALFGVSPALASQYAGSYTLEQTGDLYDANGGYLGNLAQLAQRAGKGGGSGGGDNFWSSGGAAGNSQGGCSYVSIPNSSSGGTTSVSSGC